MNLSWSQIELYDQCPFKWHQIYRMKKYEKRNVFALFGIVMHNLVDLVFKEGIFDKRKYIGLWKDLYYREYSVKYYPKVSKSELKYFEGLGYPMIHKFFKLGEKYNLLRKPIGSELKLKSTFMGWIIKGKTDLVTTSRGGLSIVDWKTGKESDNTLKQLILYGEMYYKNTGKLPKWVIPAYLKTGKCYYLPFSNENRKNTREYLSNIINKINNDKIRVPKRNKYCQYCHVKKECPKYATRLSKR